MTKTKSRIRCNRQTADAAPERWCVVEEGAVVVGDGGMPRAE